MESAGLTAYDAPVERSTSPLTGSVDQTQPQHKGEVPIRDFTHMTTGWVIVITEGVAENAYLNSWPSGRISVPVKECVNG